MELKVVCQCGQKYKFDVEPVNGQMPFTVNCPVCNADGTTTANLLLAQMLSTQRQAPVASIVTPSAPVAFVVPPPPPPPVATPPPPPPAPVGGLRISRPAPSAEPSHAPPPAVAPISAAPSSLPINQRRAAEAAAAENPAEKPSFKMGLLGGLIGTVVGLIIYFVAVKMSNLEIYGAYRYSVIAIGVGGLAGWLGNYMGKGEGSKELAGIIAVMVLAGFVGMQYFLVLGWFHKLEAEIFQAAQSMYATAVSEAKEVVQAVPNGTDTEIRAYLVKQAAKYEDKVAPDSITPEEIKNFREHELPQFQQLAGGKISKEDYEKQNEIKTGLSKEEQTSVDNTVKGLFLLLLLSKTNLFSLIAAAGLAFKLSANA
jgi:hypothetical protein